MLLGLVWHGMSVPAMVWGALALAVLLLPLHTQAHAAVGHFLRSHLASPWPWLVLSIGLCSLVLWLGVEENGAWRYYPVASLRSGLWGLVAFVVALALFSQRRVPGMAAYAGLAMGCMALAACLLAQPDFYSLQLLGVVAVVISLSARNAIRVGLPMAVGAGVAAFLAWVFVSPFRRERFWNTFFRASGEVLAGTTPSAWWMAAVAMGFAVILVWLVWVRWADAATPLQRQFAVAGVGVLLVVVGYPLLAGMLSLDVSSGMNGHSRLKPLPQWQEAR
ncbi:hypothetical protein GCM10027019_07420 [Melaminivora jejuensis]